MNTTKHSNSKGLQLNELTVSNPTKSLLSPQATSNGIITTKDQQQRIDKLLSEVRRGGPLSPEASILPQTELQRMKQAAKFMTKDELLQQKKIVEEQTEKQHAASKAKKAKMMEIERERRKNVPLTEIEQENLERDQFLRERAQTLLDEERDEVKHMNKMMLYAKVVTLRDKQLNEKKDIVNQNKAEERLKDLNMELNRLKTIKYYEDLEEYKLGEQKKAAAETMRQIEERSLIKLKIREERDKEGQEMVEKLKQNAIEDAQENLSKKRHQKLMQDMVFEENQKAIAGKALIAQMEREEEERIFRYNQEKARKDAEYQAEQKRIKDAKEAETIKLRRLQEKYADRQSEIDAIRAKRAFESADRMAREKERRDAETKARMNRELLEARHLQQLEKERRLQEQAKAERDEFQRIVQNQKSERDIELLMEREKKTRINEHSEQLKKQISMNQEKRAQNKRLSLEEGKKIKDKLSNEKNLLENIKSRKLEQLVSYDIPVKYTSELARKRIII